MCSSANPCRLLIVEDYSGLIDVLDNPMHRAQSLAMGLDYIIAPDLETAVRVLSAPDCPLFDSLLIDPHLPDSPDPFKTFDTIRSLAPDVPPFIYTGGVDQDFIDYALAHGAEQVILKSEWDIRPLFVLLHYGAGQSRARRRYQIEHETLVHERDHWKKATATALRKSDEVMDKYNRLIEKNTRDVVQSSAVKALKRSIMSLTDEIKGIAAAH